jgi:hypothetical protein
MTYTIQTNSSDQHLNNFLDFTEEYLKSHWKDVTIERSS